MLSLERGLKFGNIWQQAAGYQSRECQRGSKNLGKSWQYLATDTKKAFISAT